jgi:glycosyltransferase involved in cell wall biosynthesis
LRILQIANPSVSIPPTDVGGVERIVHALIVELQRLGHEITLLAEDSSRPPHGVEFHGIGTYWKQEKTTRLVWSHLARFGSRYDVIHNHGGLKFFLPRIWGRSAKVHTFHIGELLVPNVRRFLSLRPRRFSFVPCGHWIEDKFVHLGGRWETINNGIPADLYRPNFNVPSDAPLVIVSRMAPSKGISTAINVALKSNRKLVLAGRIGDMPHEKEWFREEVERFCDGRQITFVGPVTDREKQELLANAAAVLLPIQASEAFNVFMIEALACGTPVIGYDLYCIPELVKDGQNGFLARNEGEMIAKVGRLGEIDRRNCRRDFEERFTSEIMARRYVELYGKLGGR